MNTKLQNRIEKLFEEKKGNILSIYFTAGYPALTDTVNIVKYLEEAGADLVEIGIPFSDPVADGPTIQASNQQALENGMTMKLLFEQLSEIRNEVKLPIILMGYLNPVIQFGIENFCRKCEQCGIDGMILPDLPLQEYLDEYKGLFESFGLLNTFLISPQTSLERIKLIDESTKGFIYMVSSAAITGAKKGISEEQVHYFKRMKSMNLKNPTLVGFGISDHESFSKASEYSSGAIIGSAFINLLKNSQDMKEEITGFVRMIKEGNK
jgi:tryptophan synthase alpha chain